jgi:hypothetical protein
MGYGKFGEEFRHPGCKPTITATPVIVDIKCVKKEAIGSLQLVEIGRHFESGTVKVLPVAGTAKSLNLEDRDHPHIVDPETCFLGQAIGIGLGPLRVGVREAEFEVAFVFDEEVEL